ncbi:MAG: Gfo/Idh/MocA family oxidoreductase [Synergistaceae bacterium]|nr:Gfo/Idh/MocA family oxidoreductase [Synergistaceae bacterium]
MKKVVLGIVGAGFASHFHCRSFSKVAGIDVRVKSAADIDLEKAAALARNFGLAEYHSDYRALIDDPEIDVIDICTPPFLHSAMTIEALEAGKHVICEKPLTGYFGSPGDPEPIGDKVSREVMYSAVLDDLEGLEKAAAKSDRLFMYAENYVYSPNIQKTAEIIRARKSKILFMKGEESLKGSTSPVAGRWDKTGGGSLMRVGCHPVGGILWLKREEARARGEVFGIKSVVCDVARMTDSLTERERRHISVRPEDVEDFASLTLTFSDGTKAVVIAGDTMLGGTRNYVEVYANDAVMYCQITPSDNLSTYMLDEEGMEGVYISEMLPAKTGWQKPFVAEDCLRGYTGQFQDFMECAATGRKPLSDFDLARDAAKVIYGAYLSAERGEKFEF